MKDAQSIDETYDTFKSIGNLTHKEKQANQLVKETKDNVNKVVQSIPKHHKNKMYLLKYHQNQIFTQQVSILSLMIC